MKRVLAIDPITKGFGFAILDGPHCLIEWGLKGTSRWKEPRDRWCLREVARLIDLYQPDRIVIEDCFDSHSRRGPTGRRLIEGILEVAGERGIVARRISRAGLRRAFQSEDARTKYKTALAIAGRFPELAWRLPPIRKPWMSEDARMGIFDAVALALAFYRQAHQNGSSEAVTVSALKGGEITPSIMRRR
jgi:hypothetical protein